MIVLHTRNVYPYLFEKRFERHLYYFHFYFRFSIIFLETHLKLSIEILLQNTHLDCKCRTIDVPIQKLAERLFRYDSHMYFV